VVGERQGCEEEQSDDRRRERLRDRS
jgi:hypothetical protein